MNELLFNPVMWGALAGLGGTMAGGWLARKSAREETEVKRFMAQTADDKQDFEALHTTVTVLQAEQARLRADVQEMRRQINDLQLRHRKIAEKYSSAIAFINLLLMRGRDLLARLDQLGVDHGTIPDPPDNIADDLKS